MIALRNNTDWIERSFVLSFYFLLRYQISKDENIYYNALRLTIQQGGDTDPNASIVGGMIGALVGIK